MSRRRKKPSRSPVSDFDARCPDGWRAPVGMWDGVVLVHVRIEAGVECPLCDDGTVHPVEMRHDVWVRER